MIMTMRFHMCMLFVVALLAAPLLYSCSEEDDPSSIAPEPVPIENNLVFVRSDGIPVSFDTFTSVWIGDWESAIPIESLHLVVGSNPLASEPLRIWSLKAVVDDIALHDEFEFPHTSIWNKPTGVTLFVARDPNEWATSEEGSGGGITFTSFREGFRGEVSFSIDAAIGSEYADGDTLFVRGTFRAPIMCPPPVPVLDAPRRSP
jgi:hypothetical protein